MSKAARVKVSKAKYLEAKLSARQDYAIASLAGFVRYMWGVPEGDTTDGLDDVRRKMGLIKNEVDPYSGKVKERTGDKLLWNWHLDILCEELEALARGYVVDEDGEPKRYGEDSPMAGQVISVDELVINIPPGHMKSMLSSVMFPAWTWLHNPGWQLLGVANAPDLASRDAEFMRKVVKSERYKGLLRRMAFVRGMENKVTRKDGKPSTTQVLDMTGKDVTAEHVWGLDPSTDAKVDYLNTLGGKRYSTSIWSKVTGKRCNGIIVDDPLSSKEARQGSSAHVAERVATANETYTVDLSTRKAPGGWRLVIMQRLHRLDLSSLLLPQTKIDGSGVRCVVLPCRFDPDHEYRHPKDPRTEPGELLFPKFFTERDDIKAEVELKGKYAAQYGQAPEAGEGGSFQRSWFNQRYKVAPWYLLSLAKFSQIAISVDCTFKKGKKTDLVSMQVWAKLEASGITGRPTAVGLRPGKYLLDQVCERMTFLETCQALRLLRQKWPTVTLVLVEAKANGEAVIDTMRAEGHSGVVGYNPKASKEERAEISVLAFEAAEVWLPQDKYAPWVEGYIAEHEQFPGGAHDDQVDATSQMMIRWGVAEDPVSDFEDLSFLGMLPGMM